MHKGKKVMVMVIMGYILLWVIAVPLLNSPNNTTFGTGAWLLLTLLIALPFLIQICKSFYKSYEDTIKLLREWMVHIKDVAQFLFSLLLILVIIIHIPRLLDLCGNFWELVIRGNMTKNEFMKNAEAYSYGSCTKYFIDLKTYFEGLIDRLNH